MRSSQGNRPVCHAKPDKLPTGATPETGKPQHGCCGFCLSLAGKQTARQENATRKEKSDKQNGKPLTARRTPPQPPGQTQQPWPIDRLWMSKPLSPPLDNSIKTTKTPSTRNRILYAQDAAPHHPV
jgi:hypothetical protein